MNREEYYAHIVSRCIPSDPFWQTYHRHRFETFNALVPADSRRVLDFGCGTADVMLLAGPGHDVVGIDPVPEMIEFGRERRRAGGVIPPGSRTWTGCTGAGRAASTR